MAIYLIFKSFPVTHFCIGISCSQFLLGEVDTRVANKFGVRKFWKFVLACFDCFQFEVENVCMDWDFKSKWFTMISILSSKVDLISLQNLLNTYNPDKFKNAKNHKSLQSKHSNFITPSN